ncbi:MAG: nitroreductase [Pseudomonadales bacterium]
MAQQDNAPDVIAALCSRVSVGELVEPAPSPWQREKIFRAALRAPDHGQLRPWRFLWVEGEARQCVGHIIAEVEAQCYGELSAAQHQKSANRLLRAPLVLLVVAHITAHAKVPEIEQVMSTAAAVQNMLNAAHALGVGVMWRSGLVTYEPLLAEKLGLAANERLLGFLYLGTPAGTVKQTPVLEVDQFFSAWTPQ